MNTLFEEKRELIRIINEKDQQIKDLTRDATKYNRIRVLVIEGRNFDKQELFKKVGNVIFS